MIRRNLRGRWVLLVCPILLLSATFEVAPGQTDYYNTDRHRPVRIEDAQATERYAIEIKLAPVKVERIAAGAYRWSLDPEVAYGVLPRTSVELGLPLVLEDASGGQAGIAGAKVSLFHNLNTETRTLPAFAIRGDLALPLGELGPERLIPSVTAIATRSLGIGRVHINAGYTFSDPEVRAVGDDGTQEGHEEVTWMAGIAVDRALPLDAILLIADLHVSQPHLAGADLAWSGSGGLRYQVNPYLAVDIGGGRRFTSHPTWFATVGSALHLGVRPLIPLGR